MMPMCRHRTAALLPGVLCLVAAACETEGVFVKPEASLERMIEQPRADAYDPSAFFADGKVILTPPEGTVASDAITDNRAYAHGIAKTDYIDTLPLPVTDELLQRGRDRYDIYCAPCHGLLGTAQTSVADNMPVMRPRSLHSPRVHALPTGRIFRTIREGFGMMASYAAQLSVRDTWAVVAYVRALQISQSVALRDLPQPLRQRARRLLQDQQRKSDTTEEPKR